MGANTLTDGPNYFKILHATKGAMTLLGAFSSDRALTHINITIDSIVDSIVKTVSLI